MNDSYVPAPLLEFTTHLEFEVSDAVGYFGFAGSHHVDDGYMVVSAVGNHGPCAHDLPAYIPLVGFGVEDGHENAADDVGLWLGLLNDQECYAVLPCAEEESERRQGSMHFSAIEEVETFIEVFDVVFGVCFAPSLSLLLRRVYLSHLCFRHFSIGID